MSRYTTMPNGSSFAGRAVRHNTESLERAIRARTGYYPSGTASSGVPIHVSGGKCAGYVVFIGGRRMLRKTRVRRDLHYCVKHGGYGVELAALRQAQQLGVQAVRLVFDDGAILQADLSDFAANGIRDQLGGFGVQVFLPLRFWRDPREPQLSLEVQL